MPRRYFQSNFLPARAVAKGWEIFITEEKLDGVSCDTFSIIERATSRVLFTWYREPSLTDVLEVSEELLKQEALS